MRRSLCVVLLLAAGLARADDLGKAASGDQVAYWTTRYQGEDLVSGKLACKRPVFPAFSTSKQDIAAVQEKLSAWRDCYQRFAATVNARTAAGERIPPEVLGSMTPAEAGQAQRHVDAVYAGLVAQARKEAAQVAADEHAWLGATEYYVDNYRNPGNGVMNRPKAWVLDGPQFNWPRMAPPAPTGVLH